MGYAHAVLMVLFVTGFALFAYGVTYRDPSAGTRVKFATIQPEEVPESSDVVRYRDLPDTAQRAFDRAVDSGSPVSVAVASAATDADYVRHGDRYYAVDVVSGTARSAVELPLGLVGLVLSVLSTLVYGLLRRERAH